jgi:uncharacterized protein (TIGR04255 family)
VTPPLALPEAPYERLARPPLQAMLGQIRFPTILSVADAAFISPLQEAIRGDFPELRAERQVGLEVTAQGEVTSESNQIWRFTSEDGIWSVVLAPDFLTLEATSGQYTHFDQFQRRFGSVWERALPLLRPAVRVQQGLRYVNHIPGDNVEVWRRFINPELLGTVANPIFADEVVQSLCDIRLNRPDGQLAFKHGVVPAGPERQLGYVLDFDYFTQERSDQMETAVVLDLFSAYHAVIYSLFRWCVTEEAIEHFGKNGEDHAADAS